MIVFLLGLSILLHISDAYVVHPYNAQEEPKSITMFINGQDNPESRRRATGQHKQHKRNSEDVLEELYNNAPESGKKRQHGAEPRSKHHHQLRSNNNEMDLMKVVSEVVNYFTKSGSVHGARSAAGGGTETKIDLVKLVNGAFTYLASLNPKYRANTMRSTHLEPRPIEVRSKDDTSLLYEINTKRIVEDVTDFLSSKTMKGYVDNIARKAATIYRAVTKDH